MLINYSNQFSEGQCGKSTGAPDIVTCKCAHKAVSKRSTTQGLYLSCSAPVEHVDVFCAYF